MWGFVAFTPSLLTFELVSFPQPLRLLFITVTVLFYLNEKEVGCKILFEEIMEIAAEMCPRKVLRRRSVLGRKGGFEIGDGGVNLGEK